MKLLISFSILVASCSYQLCLAQGAMSELAAIRFAYENNSDRKIKGLTSEIGYDQWEFRTPLFFKESGDWRFAGGIRYQSTSIDITDASLLNESRLHSLDFAFFLSKKSSDTLDYLLLFNPALSGDYENVGSDALNYLSIAGAKWKQSDQLQWIFGAVYTSGIGDDLLLPAIGLIWEPSAQSSFVFAGPILRYNYEFSDSLDLTLGGQFVGNRWNTESLYGGATEERNFRFRSYRLFGNVEWNFDENHSVFVGGGFDFAGEIEIESTSNKIERDVESGGSFEIGYQYQF